jgi:hypothetical protein
MDREGIHIDRDLAESVAIEEELDANVLGDFLFPDPRRRRIAGWVFLVAGLVSLLVIEGGWIVAWGSVFSPSGNSSPPGHWPLMSTRR